LENYFLCLDKICGILEAVPNIFSLILNYALRALSYKIARN